MREVSPAYRPGDRVELHGEEFEVSSYQTRGDAGLLAQVQCRCQPNISVREQRRARPPSGLPRIEPPE
jgi:hypothetical protein